MAPETLGPGSIVMAEPGNFDHYFLESLVLIVQHDDKGTKGVPCCSTTGRLGRSRTCHLARS